MIALPVRTVTFPRSIVRFVDLNEVSNEVLHMTFNLLSDMEKARHDTISNTNAAQQFLVGRALLRQYAAQQLCTKPDKLVISIDLQGKPRLADYRNVDFSISHSGAIVALAWSTNGPVGLDVQAVTEIAEPYMEIANLVFRPSEQTHLTHKASKSETTFFRIWTAREAFLKLYGTGMADDELQDSFAVDPVLEVYRDSQGLPSSARYRTFEMVDAREDTYFGALAQFFQTPALENAVPQ